MTGPASTPDVSVVLISFNDAARLPRAIRSVQSQTLRNVEIIVVDDASTDDTESRVRALAAEDPRIRYERLAQNSAGCSAPRNRGLELARAPWVMFCDSDDEYERHACKNLLQVAERLDADVVCGTAERVDVRSGRTKRWRPDVHEVERAADGLIGFPDLLYDTISVNKIYRRSLLADNAIRFPEGLLFEDQLFTLQALASARRIAAIPETVYRWYVDRLSDEPSITQRRHEARNVESRIEINRRIDAFLAERGLEEIQRIKDLKFLRHDLYLYLSSMLEVDDETAEALIVRLIPYVSSVNLGPAWDLRPALRVAIYHLLVNDLAGVRSAMRFVKWASVVEVPVVATDGREFWGCEHLAGGGAVAGVDAREWLDVTDLHITLVPFTQRRYLHRLSAFAVSAGVVTASGTTVDFDGSLADVDRLELRFLSGDRVVASIAASWTGHEGRVWQWHANDRMAGRLGRRLTAKDQGTLGLALGRGPLENVSNCRATEADMPRIAVPYRGRTEPLGPDSLEMSAYGNGAVGWHAARMPATRGRLARWRNGWFRIPGTRRLVVIAGVVRRDVVLGILQRVGALLPARRMAVLLTAGGRTVTDNVRSISGELFRSDPALAQAWVHRGRPELVPDYAEPVEHMSARHHWLLARARYWIDDGTSPLTVRKPRHTTAVLVGDGVPVHRVGLDDPSVLVSRAAVREVTSRSRRSDLLVTASGYATDRLRSALSFRGIAVEAGIARLDGAIGMRSPGAVDDMRRAADLPTDRAIVVYAPAFRRRQSHPVEPLIDLDRWAASLGERAYLLLRPPRQQRFAVTTPLRFAVRSIPEEADLAAFLGMADIVVSDFSPVIGDAALLDLPIVLFQPDRDIFVNRTRGIYQHAGQAGPVTTTIDGLLDEVDSWLSDREAWESRHGAPRRVFAAANAGLPTGCRPSAPPQASSPRDPERRDDAAQNRPAGQQHRRGRRSSAGLACRRGPACAPGLSG